MSYIQTFSRTDVTQIKRERKRVALARDGESEEKKKKKKRVFRQQKVTKQRLGNTTTIPVTSYVSILGTKLSRYGAIIKFPCSVNGPLLAC